MSKIVETAIVELGVYESPPNSNNVKYNTWFYNREVSDGDKPNAKYPWCATFVSWVYNKAGSPLGAIDYAKGFAGCPYAVKNIDKWGKIVTKPEAGFVVFFDWEGDGTFDHTAIFEKDLGNGMFSSIEGNTALPKTGNPSEIKAANSNGGAVMRRSDRKYKNAIFVKPNVLV